MCILSLHSDNLNFGQLISIPVDSPMQVKSMRKGFVFGFYPKGSRDTYIVYFADSDIDPSYKSMDQNFEHLNTLKYSSPVFVINVITDIFGNALKLSNIDTNGTNSELFVNMVNITNNTFEIINRIEKFYQDFTVDKKEVASNSYQMTISTNKPLSALLNFCIIYFCLISSLNNDEFDSSGNTLNKMLDAINNTETPYYVRHIISARVLKNQKLFDKFKGSIETSNIRLNYGNIDTQRKEFIQNEVPFDKPIIDIGCGDGFLAIPFAQILSIRCTDPRYFAIDIDENSLITLNKKAKDTNLTNILTFTNHKDLIYDVDKTKKFTIIISNVIEYMVKDEVISLIVDILLNLNFDKLIITTPNKDFNKHYGLNKVDSRDTGHKWQINKDLFSKFINEVFDKEPNQYINKADYRIRFVDIGDVVDNVSSMTGVIMSRK